MEVQSSKVNVDNQDNQNMPEYSAKQELINNIPYGVMTLLGSLIFIVAFSGLTWGKIAGVAYLLLFIGKRAIECCDLIAVAIIAYLFALFIYTLFLAKKEG